MTYLDTLKKLAQEATQSEDWGHDDCSLCDAAKEFHAACSPERILALLAVIEAAKVIDKVGSLANPREINALRSALAQLEKGNR